MAEVRTFEDSIRWRTGHNAAAKAARPITVKRKARYNATIRVRHIELRRAEGRALSWAMDRYEAILARGDEDRCYLCGCDLDDGNRTIDHVRPKCRGGGDALVNLKLACAACNMAKGGLLLGEFLARLKGRTLTRRVA